MRVCGSGSVINLKQEGRGWERSMGSTGSTGSSPKGSMDGDVAHLVFVL